MAPDRSRNRTTVADLAADFSPPHVVQRVSVGLLCGVIGVVFALSYAALLFAGPLSAEMAAGIGMMLFSGGIFAVVAAFLSTYRPIYAQVREVPIAYLALVAPVVAAEAAAGSGAGAVAPTVVALVAVTAIILGVASRGRPRS